MNSKGIYVGACVRCEVVKSTSLCYYKQCPVSDYPTGQAVYDKDQRLVWLPVESEWRQGILYFESNQRILEINTDEDAGGTLVTPTVISEQIDGFREYHADDIAYLAERCVSVEVVWAVVPWYEF